MNKKRDVQRSLGGEDCHERALIPGLPDHLAAQCLSRVPSLYSLWGVSKSWQELLGRSCNSFFHVARTEIGNSNLNWLYVLIASSSGASFAWHAFDPVATEWHRLPPMPHGTSCFELSRPGFLGPHSHSIQCASTSHKLFVVAGTRLSVGRIEPALESPLVFDVYTGAWSRGPRYITPRRWCCCGTVRGKLLVASGCGSEWDISTATSAEVWDTSAVPAVWRAVPSLASPKYSREATSAVECAARLHVVTARVGAVFDAETETWSDMPQSVTRCWNGTGVAYSGQFYVVEETAGRIKRYEESTVRWVSVVEDERIKKLANVVGWNGKICGSVDGLIRVSVVEDERIKKLANVVGWNGKICGSVDGLIRVVDLTTKPVRFREIKLPVPGQVVAMQILNGMLS